MAGDGIRGGGQWEFDRPNYRSAAAYRPYDTAVGAPRIAKLAYLQGKHCPVLGGGLRVCSIGNGLV